MDRVRVFRVIEYEGPRDVVERTILKSLHEVKIIGVGARTMSIRAATIGTYPEILGQIAEADAADGAPAIFNPDTGHFEHDTGGEG